MLRIITRIKGTCVFIIIDIFVTIEVLEEVPPFSHSNIALYIPTRTITNI